MILTLTYLNKCFKQELSEDSSWLVGCFGLNGPLRQYFSLYRAGALEAAECTLWKLASDGYKVN